MNSLKNVGFPKMFSHIYIEDQVWDLPFTRQIIEQFPDSKLIRIHHYKDVFCRTKQDVTVQQRSKKLILAAKQNHLLYQGAQVCQSFGHSNFYYTSCMMNCLYHCEYCYLQGMYPSADVVIFVNLEDIFEEVEKMLQQHDLYLCVSYDTDLAAFEHLTGYTKRWIEFVKQCEKNYENPFTIEIRTKSAHTKLWTQMEPSSHVILAYTLSPEQIIASYEHGTPSLAERIKSIQYAMDAGFQVRLCFDPILYDREWRQQYRKMMDLIYQEIDTSRILDVSVGTFRVSQDYLKEMRKNAPDSCILQFPYENDHKVYHYQKSLADEMVDTLTDFLLERFDKSQIFSWEP